jgi:hypothetical protein
MNDDDDDTEARRRHKSSSSSVSPSAAEDKEQPTQQLKHQRWLSSFSRSSRSFLATKKNKGNVLHHHFWTFLDDANG